MLRRYLLISVVFIINIILTSPVIFAQNKEYYSFGVIKDDFLVNDDTIGFCDQLKPDVAIGSNNNFIFCWGDQRDYQSTGYYQVYDSSGYTIGNNRRVDDNIHCCGASSISADSAGNFAIAWVDTRNDEDGDIFCRLFATNGIPASPAILVNDDDTVSVVNRSPRVAMRLDGSFVIMWHDTRENGNGKLYAQRYDQNGNPLGANFKITDDQTSWYSIAADSIGNFYITWSHGNSIFASKYDYNGNPIIDSFQVCDSATAIDTDVCPSIACSNEGRFVISWTDKRNQSQWWYDIYGQYYDETCTPIGMNFRINDDTTQQHQHYSSASMDAVGNFVICWGDDRGPDRLIYAQKFDTVGNKIGPNFVVSDNPDSSVHLYSHIAMSNHGNFVITWQKIPLASIGWIPDVAAQRYDRYANPIGGNFIVNDDVGANRQSEQCIATYPSQGFVVSWKDDRDTTYSIYYQIFDSLGNECSINRIASDPDVYFDAGIDVSMDGHGDIILVWSEYFAGTGYLISQMIDSSGNPIGSNFMVTSNNAEEAAVAKDWAGNFVISWVRDDPRDIFAKRYDSLGNQIGPAFKVNEGESWVGQCDVAMDSCGNFVVVWCDYDGPEEGVFGQRVDYNGNPIGGNFRISSVILEDQVWAASVDMNLHGYFAVTWCDCIHNDFWVQAYDSTGNPIGTNERVNTATQLDLPVNSSVTIHPRQNKYVVFWTDRRNPDDDPEVFAQLYQNGIPIGGNAQINNPDSFPYNIQSTTNHSVDATENGVYFTWLDCRRHKGPDTYAKITDWELTGCKEIINNSISVSFDVVPSISSCGFTIKYIMTRPNTQIDINIYDVSGRSIRQYRCSHPESYNEIVWHGQDDSGFKLPNGIYFITFKTDNYQQTKKVILVK